MSTQSESLVVEEPTPVQCSDWCSTECVVKKHSIKWKVNKKFENNAIRSSPFNVGKLEACLALKAIDVNATKSWSLYLQILTRYDTFPRGRFLVNYVYNSKSHQQEIMIRADTFKQELGWGFPVIVLQSDRITAEFDCTIWHVEVDNRLKPTSEHSKTLSANYLQLLKDGDLSDVTLKVGGGSLKAHKLILSSRSPVFAAMLTADMTEARSGEIVIEDIEMGVMLILLRFIYSGCLDDNSELNKDLMLELLRAADKYDTSDLREICSAALVKLINIENATELRTVAVLYNDDKLKTAVELFMRQNMRAVTQTNGWREMKKSRPEVALEILESVLCPQCKISFCTPVAPVSNPAGVLPPGVLPRR